MIGAAVSAVAGIAGGIMGNIKAGQAAREQQRLIESAKRDEQAWYDRNYYQNSIDSSSGRAAIKRVEDTLKKRSETAQATAAVMGGTPEAVLAQQANDQQLMSDTVGNLAEQDTARKAQIDAQHQNNQQNFNAQQMQQLQMNEAGASQVASSGMGLIGTALSGMDFKKKGG